MLEHLTNASLWAALLMGACAPLFGRHLVLGRTLLLGLALPQVSLAGVAFVFFGAAAGWGWCTSIEDETTRGFVGAALFTFPALLLLARKREFKESTLAFVYLAAIAAANLLLCGQSVSEVSTHDLFHGRLLLLSRESFVVLASVLLGCSAVAFTKRRTIALILSDPDFALSVGHPVVQWHYGLAFLNGAVISVAVATVGPLVTFAFLILPVLAAATFAKSLSRHLFWASSFGVLMGLAGFTLSYRYDLPLGDAVVATGCVALVACHIFKRWAK